MLFEFATKGRPFLANYYLKDLFQNSSKKVLESGILNNPQKGNRKLVKSIGVIFLIGKGEYHYKKEERKKPRSI